MLNLSLNACSFHLKKLYSRGATRIYNLNAPIDTIRESDNTVRTLNVTSMFEEFFIACSAIMNDDNTQKTFSCVYTDECRGETEDFVYMYAIIHSGAYGSASEIRDTVSHKIKYKKSATEADERQFYLFVVIPKDSDQVTAQKGMLFFQNVGAFGVKTITTDLMTSHFSKQYGITLRCNTIAASLFVKKILKKDNVKKLVMIKNHLSDDAADNGSVGYGTETRMISNIRFSDTIWEKIMGKILWCSQGRHNLFEFEQKEYDLKVIVSIGGKERVVDVHNIENLSIIEAIPDEIKMADGLPNKVKLLEHFKKIANEYLSEMVLHIG